jgi:hypothetical protein
VALRAAYEHAAAAPSPQPTRTTASRATRWHEQQSPSGILAHRMDAPRAPAALTMSEPPPCGSRKHHAEPADALVRDPATSSIPVRAAPAQSDPGLRLHGGRGKSQRPTAAADQTSARRGHSGRDPSIGSYRIPATSGVLRRPPASASTGSLPVRSELGHVGTVSMSTATIRMQVSRPGWVLALLFAKGAHLGPSTAPAQ